MDQEKLNEVWENITTELKNFLSEKVIENWFSQIVVKEINFQNNTLILSVPTKLRKDFIEQRYIMDLTDACKNVLKTDQVNIEFEIQETPEELPKEEVSLFNNLNEPSNGETYVKPEAPGQIAPGDASSLNPKYVFETFVTGSFNRLAHAAALNVAKNPGQGNNPLFMYGGVGLGKTHLMHAIGHEVLKNDPDKRVLYITSEKFTNELINSIRDNTPEAFRQKYRNIDLLMVDDIQFLSKKIQTQEEFFHTFNALYQANKQIVLSSDPDLETRIAILQKKAYMEKIDVDNEALAYIANRIDSNIRELEGGLTRVVAYADLIGENITTDLVADALKDVYPESHSKEITMDVIQEVVASYYNLKVDDLNSSKRTKALAFPRQIAMYLCRELTDTSLPQIGEFFGGRDHTTVLHAHNKISEEKAENIKLDNTLQELVNKIKRI